MKHFFIISRNEDESRRELIRRLTQYIQQKGGVCSCAHNPEDGRPGEIAVPEGTQCILTVGGDGTLIRAAQNTFGSNIPLLGVNCGHLGYLCELDRDNVFDAVDDLFADRYQVEERMMLSGSIAGPEGRSPETQALNDVVLSCSAGIQIIQLTVYVNGEHLYSYNCDGMIFSTPTGSTAYNLSANGPIVNPKTNLILLTPINPHTLNSRSIVLDSSDEIVVEITSRRKDITETAEVRFDGSHKMMLRPGERLTVRKAKQKTRMIQFSNISFLERIRIRMREN
ncbi:MAG: NAD(+)/NADH kinase [Lachnospiraceae bacterium]